MRDYHEVRQLLDAYQKSCDKLEEEKDKKHREYLRTVEGKPEHERNAAYNNDMLPEYRNADSTHHHLRVELIKSLFQHLIRSPTRREGVIQGAFYQEQAMYEEGLQRFVLEEENTSPRIASTSSPDTAQEDHLSPP